MTANERVAEVVKCRREALGWTQRSLALRAHDAGGLGWTAATIARVERGRCLSVREAQILAQLLHLAPADLGA
jgi:transcriptional regulator with XRE-family HTH domain